MQEGQQQGQRQGQRRGLRRGLDIGGTKIGICLGTDEGEVVASDRFPTAAYADPSSAIDGALARLKDLGKGLGIETDGLPLGVCCPGPYDSAAMRFLNVPNMPAWQGFDLGAALRAKGVAAFRTMNDANAAGLAEALWGAGRGAHTVVYLTMSTGMGAGVVIEGRVLEGQHGFGAEIGMIRLSEEGPVGFGSPGTVEGYCSGTGLSQMAYAEIIGCAQRGEATALSLCSDNLPPDARQICTLAESGDPAARRVTDASARRLGELIAILGAVLEPSVVVLGTIGSAYPDLFIPGATAVMKARVRTPAADRMRIVPSGISDRGNVATLAVAAHVASARA